jgi:hypothetical protein
MCDEESVGIGDLVPDGTVLYRACSRPNYLTLTKDSVQEIAFQKDGKNHKDGLSLALSVDESVRYLKKNHGVIRITAGAIHQLGRGLEVRFKPAEPLHVLVRNLPCMDRTPAEKEMALKVSAELAGSAGIESATPVPKPA